MPQHGEILAMLPISNLTRSGSISRYWSIEGMGPLMMSKPVQGRSMVWWASKLFSRAKCIGND